MKNLIKYEFRKTRTMKLIILGIAAFAELLFLVSLYTNRERWNSFSIVLLTMLAFGGVMLIGIQSVLTMHRDMNTREGYMLYMTPNSCYKILGSKVLENGLSIFAAGAFFFALGSLDVVLLLGHVGELDRLVSLVNSLLQQMRMEIPLGWQLFAWLTVSFLSGWLLTVVTAYLADVVACCLLYRKKFNGLVSLLLFIAINWAFSALVWACIRNLDLLTTLAWDSLLSLVCAAMMYAVTAFLMDRHLSV